MAGGDKEANGSAASPAPRPRRRGALPLADLIAGPLAASCRRRGFATADLLSHWPDIVGPAYADTTMPDRLVWPRRPQGLIDDDDHAPARLTIRCTGATALRLAHETPLVLERINTYFGYRVVGEIRLLQLPPARMGRPPRPAPRPVSADERGRISALASDIDDAGLRAAVERLGLAIAGDPRRITKS